MKNVFLVFTFLNFFSKLLCAPTNIGELDHHLQKKISDFLHVPQQTLGSVNKNGRQIFREIYPAKTILNERISIPELEEVDENEPELRSLLKLTCFAENPSLFYQAVFEDVTKEKTPYIKLYRPLIKYLDRTFNQQGTIIRMLLKDEKYKLKASLLKHYNNISDPLSAFNIVKDLSKEMISWYSETSLNNAKVYEMFKTNPEKAEILKSELFFGTLAQKADWIFGCIIYDAPESFYIDFFNRDPLELFQVLFKSIEGMLIEIPELEFPRINQKLKTLVRSNCWGLSSYFDLIIDIRYNPEYQNMTTNLSLFDLDKILNLAKVAFSADKKELFYQIFSSNEKMFDQPLNEMIKEFMTFPNVSKQFLIIFELLNRVPSNIKTKILKDSNVLRLLLKYYAIKKVKLEDDHLIFDLVAPNDLLIFNFPSNITLYPCWSEIYPSEAYSNNGFGFIWPAMKVIDEVTFLSFLSSYEKLIMNFKKKLIRSSFNVLKLVASSQSLITKIRSMGMRFENPDHVTLKLLEHVPITCIRRLNQILCNDYIPGYYIPYLNTENQLKNFEEFTGKSVADHFLITEENNSMTEFDYFKWRFAFKYWINGSQRYKIDEISSTVIKNLLKKEFQQIYI